jgi:hypothetical protein
MNELRKTGQQSATRRFGDDGTAGLGGDRRTQRVSHKLPKTRGVRLLLPLPESVIDAYGIGCFGLDRRPARIEASRWPAGHRERRKRAVQRGRGGPGFLGITGQMNR